MKEKETRHSIKNTRSGNRYLNNKNYEMYSFRQLPNGDIICYFYNKKNYRLKAHQLMPKSYKSTFTHTYGYWYGLTHISISSTGLIYHLLPVDYNIKAQKNKKLD